MGERVGGGGGGVSLRERGERKMWGQSRQLIHT